MLTNHRLVVYPHELDDAIGGDSWECSLDSIESVGIADRGRNLFDGSIRRRLEVDAGGPHQFFVVSKVVEPVGSMRLTAAVLRVISGEETHTRKFRWGAFHMECRRHTVPTSHGGPIGER